MLRFLHVGNAYLGRLPNPRQDFPDGLEAGNLVLTQIENFAQQEILFDRARTEGVSGGRGEVGLDDPRPRAKAGDGRIKLVSKLPDEGVPLGEPPLVLLVLRHDFVGQAQKSLGPFVASRRGAEFGHDDDERIGVMGIACWRRLGEAPRRRRRKINATAGAHLSAAHAVRP